MNNTNTTGRAEGKSKTIKSEVTVNGKNLKRVSQNRTYAFAIVATGEEGRKHKDGAKSNSGWRSEGFYAISWSSRRDLAEKAFAALYRGDKKPSYENAQIVAVGASVTIENKFSNILSDEIEGVQYSYPSDRKLAGVVVYKLADWTDQSGAHSDEVRHEWYINAADAEAEVAKMLAEEQEVCLSKPAPGTYTGVAFYMAKTGLKKYALAKFIPAQEAK